MSRAWECSMQEGLKASDKMKKNKKNPELVTQDV